MNNLPFRPPREKWWPRGKDKLTPEAAQGARIPLVDKTTAVASMGSCFASEIRKYLVGNGYNYLVTAKGRTGRAGSANWGLVYNTFCMRQEFERAFDGFNPVERYWHIGGKLVDPYRREIVWPDKDTAEKELGRHAKNVRSVIESAGVFVLTLGLTEIWRGRGRTVLAVPPPAAVFDQNKYVFERSGLDENVLNLETCHALLESVNPSCHMIVTVSPVPLRITFGSGNAITANSLSKATLLVAARTFADAHKNVHYFPSYEIATSLVGDPYEDDNRHVREEVVAQIMEAFIGMFGRNA